MRTLAVVPARADSKGIQHKNTRDFMGKPLFAWAVEIGRKTCDRTLVTTDSIQTALLAAQYGADTQLRPAFLAQDDTPMIAVLQHAIRHSPDVDAVVLLQPTSPLRTVEHVKRGIELLESSDADSVVSVSEIPAHYSPEMACVIEDGILEPWNGAWLKRRQDARTCYYRCGTLYVTRISAILRGEIIGRALALTIPAHEAVNIDEPGDWVRAESLWQKTITS